MNVHGDRPGGREGGCGARAGGTVPADCNAPTLRGSSPYLSPAAKQHGQFVVEGLCIRVLSLGVCSFRTRTLYVHTVHCAPPLEKANKLFVSICSACDAFHGVGSQVYCTGLPSVPSKWVFFNASALFLCSDPPNAPPLGERKAPTFSGLKDHGLVALCAPPLVQGNSCRDQGRARIHLCILCRHL